MASEDDDGKNKGFRCLPFLYSYWPTLLRLLLVALGALLLLAVALRRWYGMETENVIYKASNSGLDMGIMNSLRGFGGDEFHYHTFVPTVDDAADAANGNGPEADALGTAVTQGTVEEEVPASALEAVDWDAGNGNQEEIEEAEAREVEETANFAKMYKKLNPGSEISRMAAVQVKTKLCGNFVQQRLQLISVLLAAVSIGAQVVLPEEIGTQKLPFGQLFDVEKMKQLIQKVYTRHWCTRRTLTAHQTWCSNAHIPGMLTAAQMAQFLADREIVTETLLLSKNITNFRDARELQNYGERLWSKRFPNGIRKVDLLKVDRLVSIEVDCHFYKKVRFAEPAVEYRKFWSITDALVWNTKLVRTQEEFQRKLFRDFGAVARDKAKSLGYSHPEEPKFAVLKLPDDPCSTAHCPDLGNILLSEGVQPGLPLYIAFSSADAVKQYQSRMQGGVLETVFTVVTKDMLDPGQHDETTWAALDFMTAEGAGMFVGPSRSIFSSLVLLSRQRMKFEAFHFDGRITMLEEDGILRPEKSTAVPMLRSPLKWVFSLSLGAKTSSAWNMTLAAVRSASISPESLVPVCLTDAAPMSELAHGMVQMGVRVLYHRPDWMDKMKPIFNRWKRKSDKKWKFAFPDFDGTRGSLMRIDIPIVGFLDHFVLYTDVDIIFQRRLNWETILQTDVESFMREATEATEAGETIYGKPGYLGLPEFFAMSTEFQQSSNRDKMDTGVMLMNLRNLQGTYQNFTDFLFDPNRAWDFNTADPCGYKSYYRNKGKLVATFLPHTMNWKFYWEQRDGDGDPVIMHFHGPKCDTDIVPFVFEGVIRFDQFRNMLEHCNTGGRCQKLCKEYQGQVNAAYKQLRSR